MAAPTQAEYFAPDFDPSSLKIPQLRSILVEHGIPAPPTARKGDLVALFEQQVQPKGNLTHQALLSKASKVKASAKGIVAVSENGDETLVEPPKRGRGRPRKTAPTETDEAGEPAPKRSRQSTRVSRTPALNEEMEMETEQMIVTVPVVPAVPEGVVKKRGPGRPRKTDTAKPKVEEDGGVAEIEDEAEKVEVKKAPRKSRVRPATSPETPEPVAASSSTRQPEPPKSILKKEPSTHFVTKNDTPQSSSTPSKRKIKTARRSDGEESGFSDANPFQSGSEEAARKEIRRRRKSSMGPQRELVDTPAKTPRRSEPAPFSFTPGTLRRVGPSNENLRAPPPDVREQLLQERELDAAELYNRVVQEKLSHMTATPAQVVVTSPQPAPAPSALVRRSQDALDHIPAPKRTIPLASLAAVLLLWLSNWMSNSASIGYCDTGLPTDDAVLTRASAIDDAHACNARQVSLKLSGAPAEEVPRCDVSALPLVPFVPRPTACAPCPPHAQCEDGKVVACDAEYILSQSPFALLGGVVDGFPGLGPRAFPPHCRPDTAKKRMIGGLAQEMEGYLARGRGKVECARMGGKEGRQGEGERYGVVEATLKEVFDERRDPKVSQEQFDEIWEAALRDLIEHQDVVESIDVEGRSWYAAKRSDMTLSCRAKTQAYKSLDEWKAQLATVLAAILAAQSSVKGRRAEKYRAEELADVVLRRLQDQARSHQSDDTSPAFLPPAQVRDLVLPHKGSVASRSRTWARVEGIVERNANVATSEKEVLGELWRVWEWTGQVGRVEQVEMRGEGSGSGGVGRIKF